MTTFQIYCILDTVKLQINQYKGFKKMASFARFILLLFYILRTSEKGNYEPRETEALTGIRDLSGGALMSSS